MASNISTFHRSAPTHLISRCKAPAPTRHPRPDSYEFATRTRREWNVYSRGSVFGPCFEHPLIKCLKQCQAGDRPTRALLGRGTEVRTGFACFLAFAANRIKSPPSPAARVKRSLAFLDHSAEIAPRTLLSHARHAAPSDMKRVDESGKDSPGHDVFTPACTHRCF